MPARTPKNADEVTDATSPEGPESGPDGRPDAEPRRRRDPAKDERLDPVTGEPLAEPDPPGPDSDLVDAPKRPEQGGDANLPPPLFGVLVVAGIVVVAAGLRQAADIVGPFFLVLTIVITVHPLSSWLARRNVPQWLASVVGLLSVYGMIILVLGSVVWSLTRLGTRLPDYGPQFIRLYEQALQILAGFGISTQALSDAVSSVNLSSFAGVAQSALRSITSGLSIVALIAALVFFVVFDAAGFGERVEIIRSYRPRIADGLMDFADGTRRYWIVTTVFGFIVAVLDVIALLIIGVPLAFTWGVLAFVTNYIPNIGFLIGLIPPALIALLDGGVGPAIAVLAVYVGINVVVQTLIQPRFTGDAVGISPTVAFLSLIFWAYLLGVLGALLAVPATQFVKAMLIDHSTSGQWFGAFINSSGRERGQPKLAGIRGRKERPAS
ncbi:MAG TPA: AI-2E family transporter [Propionibacteriaceae bacterium]|jgi:predicted PurR-regulated permease PerM|nr:AI-2E family transporter [Propionibacteriaceae bacterium]